MKKHLILTAAAAPFLFVSCAQESLTGDTYSRSEARQVQAIERGTLTSVRLVKLEGGTKIGTIVGGIAGGVLGNQVGGDSTANTVGAIVGAAAGSAIGSHTEKATGTRQGVELTVRLNSGESISIVQEASAREHFKVGDKVRVLSSGSKTRVAH